MASPSIHLSRSDRLYKSSRYKTAAAKCRARSGNECQGCGMCEAESCHHWAYPAEAVPDRHTVTSDDLTAFCWSCHSLIEDYRRGRAAGLSGYLLCTAFRCIVKVLILLHEGLGR